jgi:hypothetical protein
MAQIAEDVLLLLLDNASARPGLERARRDRVLSAAVLLDLAYARRIRPALEGEPVPVGQLVVLNGPDLGDPLLDPIRRLLSERPLTPAAAMSRLRRHTQPALLQHLEHTGQIRRTRLRTTVISRPYAWPIVDRTRVTAVRSDIMAALFERQVPSAATAAAITLLHAVDGLGSLLSLNDRGWRWVHTRASEIASGSWVNEREADLSDVNLAVTTAAVRPALA